MFLSNGLLQVGELLLAKIGMTQYLHPTFRDQCELQTSAHPSCLSDSELMQPELLVFLMERKENDRRP